MPGEAGSGRLPSLVATMRSTLLQRRMLPARASVLVACSGGPDSVAMLDALHRLGPELGHRLVVASVDHGLRPEARAEVALVAQLADARGLPFVAIALGLPPGSSMAEARDARYGALRRIAGHAGTQAIAVGHTRDDQAETVLARLVRGSGLRGLRAIAPARDDGVVRPLLDATRAQVRAHLVAHDLPSAEDPTNRDDHYLRARLRHGVLPLLAQEDPAVAEHLAALADEAAALAEHVDTLVQPWVAEHQAEDGIDLDGLDRLPRAFWATAIAALVAARTGKEPGRRVVLAVIDALERGGSVWVGADLALSGAAGRLRWEPKQRPGGLVRPKER